MSEVDVVVVGGGSAGLCAAVAAARKGVKVVLLEKSDCLGGMGTLAQVHTFCGLYLPGVEGEAVVANDGLPAEIEREMRVRTSQDGPVRMGKVWVLPQVPDVYAKLAMDLVEGEDLLDVRFGSECVGVEQLGDGFVLKLGDGGVLKCGSLVDCSADAVLALLLGASRVQEREEKLQRPAFVFGLRGVGRGVSIEGFQMKLALDLVHAVRDGVLPKEVMGVSVRESPRPGEVFVSVDMNSVEVAEREGEGLAVKLREFLCEMYDFFSGCSEVVLPKVVGVRESWRWVGRHVLTADDLLEGKEFEDEVCLATWPMELREDTRGPKFRFFDRAAGIPLRCLMSDEVDGVFFAGRCLSATHEALASVRVMGTCFATGEAAGKAAAQRELGG